MKVLTVLDVRKLIGIIGSENFFKRVLTALEEDFGRWHEFMLSPRHATLYPHGVIELMPCSDRQLYAVKYVNGHPANAFNGKLSIVAVGLLSDVASGYPLMISEMTLLTAFRTAATGVLAAKYLARPEAKSLALIGTGAQAEFEVCGFAGFFELEEIRFYDSDPKAMLKFSRNLSGHPFTLVPCSTITEAVHHADIIVTATAAKRRQSLFAFEDISSGAHIHAMGGDCPGKTELSGAFLNLTKVVVEYRPQSLIEGEVQQCEADLIHAELWELVSGHKPGRENDQEITLFDAVGFALEDYSILRVVHEVATDYHLGTELPLLPEIEDPKDLYGFLNR